MKRRSDDPIWQTIREEALADAEREPMLASHVHATILNHDRLEDALSFHLAGKLGNAAVSAMAVREVIAEALASDPSISRAVRVDLQAIRERDPACRGLSVPFLYFKGFHSLQAHRVAHWLWHAGREPLALYFQSRMSEAFSVDFHPAARLGKGILIDHATGIVIGETAVVEDNVSMLHGVTLGGTGKQAGDRHPKIRAGVLIGAGAAILGNIEVGRGAKIAAGSVVLQAVPPHCTAAGVPAKIIERRLVGQPALDMDQTVGPPLDHGSGEGI